MGPELLSYKHEGSVGLSSLRAPSRSLYKQLRSIPLMEENEKPNFPCISVRS